jgi:hypothetical protein
MYTKKIKNQPQLPLLSAASPPPLDPIAYYLVTTSLLHCEYLV